MSVEEYKKLIAMLVIRDVVQEIYFEADDPLGEYARNEKQT